MKLSEAQQIAQKVLEQLKPYCEKCEIAGSIRRQKPEVKDIEIVCIPKPYETGLFESGIATIVNQWQKVKGELPCKYTQRILPEGIKLDLFFAEPGNFGAIYLIRTGDWEFSKKFMGVILPMHGYKQQDGYVHFEGKKVNVPMEKILFEKVGMRFIEPKDRNKNAI